MRTNSQHEKYKINHACGCQHLPLADSFLVLMIFAAYSCPVGIFTHLLTTEKAPLETTNQQVINIISSESPPKMTPTGHLYWIQWIFKWVHYSNIQEMSNSSWKPRPSLMLRNKSKFKNFVYPGIHINQQKQKNCQLWSFCLPTNPENHLQFTFTQHQMLRKNPAKSRAEEEQQKSAAHLFW